MERINFIMATNNNGKITVRDVLCYIMQNIPQIKVPNTDINTISLSQLTLADDRTKKCVGGIAEGRTWIGGRCTQYVFTLIFK
ncbi:hypothetical protein [Acetivibrio ethanolgignens]|uniref:Uncharacterized protein n=1 Tax=Acetivibrio ethanolgignens TaxID=290052 RepID=A0A0V8QB92_9FIRM|nr:hypothetical protein [Acetivibrio ethanolgignens]KSV57764.1 hypothetical protein ASU35_15085 [Acetivibrio ethanolgignens]